MHKKLFLLGAIFYTLILVIASLVNINGVPSLGSSFDDKIYHVVAYMILGLFWVLYFKPFKTKFVPVIVLFISILLGYILELLQYLVNPNRTYDTFDLIANTIGALIGTFIATKLKILKLK